METPEHVVGTIKSELWCDTSQDDQYIAVQKTINLPIWLDLRSIFSYSGYRELTNTHKQRNGGHFSWRRR